MERRISKALVSLDGMICSDNFSSISDDERNDYEQRVSGISKIWCFLEQKYLPNPREIARYGWKILNINSFQCCVCNNILTITDNGLIDKENENLLKNILNSDNIHFDFKLKQIGILKYSHKSYCSFLLLEIPLQYEMIYANPKIISSFQSSLIPFSSPPSIFCFLEYLSLYKKYNSYNLPKLSDDIKEFVNNIEFNNDHKNIFNNNSALLALTGWRFIEFQSKFTNSSLLTKRNTMNSRYTLVCDWCHRIIGNWNFCTEEDDIERDNETQILKKQKISQEHTNIISSLPYFNPIEQHLNFCPWIYSLEGEISGYKQIIEFYKKSKNSNTPLTLQVEEGYRKLVMALN